MVRLLTADPGQPTAQLEVLGRGGAVSEAVAFELYAADEDVWCKELKRLKAYIRRLEEDAEALRRMPA